MPRRSTGHGEHFTIDELATIFGGAIEFKVVLLSNSSDWFGGHDLLLQDWLPLLLQSGLPVEDHG